MDKHIKDIVWAHALEVRHWALSRTEDHDLCGWCAICSAELWKRLYRNGINAEIHVAVDIDNSSHVFLVVDDYIVDVTASQFGIEDDVFIRHHKSINKWFYQTVDVCFTAKELRRQQIRDKWPQKQIAYS